MKYFDRSGGAYVVGMIEDMIEGVVNVCVAEGRVGNDDEAVV